MTKFNLAQLILGAGLLTTAFYIGISTKNQNGAGATNPVEELANEDLTLRTPLLPADEAVPEPTRLPNLQEQLGNTERLPQVQQDSDKSAQKIRQPDFSFLKREQVSDQKLAVEDSLSALHPKEGPVFATPPPRNTPDGFTINEADLSRKDRALPELPSIGGPQANQNLPDRSLASEIPKSPPVFNPAAENQSFKPLLPLDETELKFREATGDVAAITNIGSNNNSVLIQDSTTGLDRRDTSPITISTGWNAESKLTPITRSDMESNVLNASAFRIHVVRTGESLQTIAARYYHSRDYYLEIYLANQDVLQSPINLTPGVSLKIPDLVKSQSAGTDR
jgi:hypothetical protein